jgi:hypothetical protein
MAMLTLRGGGRFPFWFEDIEYSSIATTNFDPIAIYQASPTSAILSLMTALWENGFGVKNATDSSGYIYAVTWSQFETYIKENRGVLPANWTLAGITPRRIDLLAGEWAVTPIVKVFAANDANFPSSITAINVGRIL